MAGGISGKGETAMKALIVEKYSPATYAFIEGLRAATGFAVDHLGNLEEALDFMVEKHLDTILVNVGHLGIDPCRATEAIRLRAKNSLVKCPQIILLSVVPLPWDAGHVHAAAVRTSGLRRGPGRVLVPRNQNPGFHHPN
jgi:DNA-binding NarL/FixJ family response regulator